ncbi:MAG TPA: 16S rRNA (cytidine(1402)-2'-O)-methyltransferase [Parachlamydiaceae bacterium]|nr:16S rRNA (cytidine(1402)-2'-O)-methyltransferase [Parachlamydiaceae bacterium]
MLYLVATPIGNLGDMTFRAVEVLKNVDYILCEDTRHSLFLLKHYDIQKPLKSFHKFNESSKEDFLIEDLKNGKTVALISDAGTPAISDPGERLVKRCHDEEIKVIPIPGASAVITAICASGLNTNHFQFCGFLPKKTKEVKAFLQEILNNTSTAICYESPKRLLNILKEIDILAPERNLTVARELTKKFEEIKRATASQLLQYWENCEIKGEIVLLIEGKKPSKETDFDTLSPKEHVQMLQETYNLTKNEAIKMAASLRGVPKRTIYNKNL